MAFRFALIALLVGLASAAYGYDEAAWRKHLNLGVELLNERQYDEALTELNLALAEGPKGRDGAYTHFVIAQISALKALPEQAVDHYKAVIDAMAAADDLANPSLRSMLTGAVAALVNNSDDRHLAAVSAHARSAGVPGLEWSLDAKDFRIELTESKAVFPKEIGGFRREGFRVISKSGWDDVAASYLTDAGTAGPRITFYVTYFPGDTANSHFDQTVASFDRFYSGIKHLPGEHSLSFDPHGAISGRYGEFRLKRKGTKQLSALFVTELDGWHFKFRGSAPWKEMETARAGFRAFLDGFPWPAPRFNPLEITVADGTICEPGPDTGKVYGELSSLEATLAATVGYVVSGSADRQNPMNQPEAFCVRDKFEATGWRVVVYQSVNEKGKDGTRVHYHFKIDEEQSFIQFASSVLLDELVGNSEDVQSKGRPVHIDHFGPDLIRLVNILDGIPPYSVARRLVIDYLEADQGAADPESEDKTARIAGASEPN